jgi:hypothetical protein
MQACRASSRPLDDTPMLPVLQHAAASLTAPPRSCRRRSGAAAATSPLRRGEHIDARWTCWQSSGAIRWSRVEVPHQFTRVGDALDRRRLEPVPDATTVTRRQDKPRVSPATAGVCWPGHGVSAGSLYGDDGRPLVMSARCSSTSTRRRPRLVGASCSAHG